MNVYVRKIPHSSENHKRAVALRKKHLYTPWNITFDEENYYTDLAYNMYGLFRGPELIGGVQVRKEVDDTVLIQDLIIKPKYRKRGLGSALLGFAEGQVPEEGAKKIITKSILSCLDFFKKNGYQVEDKGWSKSSLLTYEMSKDFSKRDQTSRLPLYDPRQDKPLALFCLEGEADSFLGEVREVLPRENLFYIEVPSLDKSWMGLVQDLREYFKMSILSPSLETRIDKGLEGVFYPSQKFLEAINKQSQSKSILLLGEKLVLDSKLYAELFSQETKGLDLIELVLPKVDTANPLKTDLFSYLSQNLEKIKKASIDSLLFGDYSYQALAQDIRSFLEENLDKKLHYYDPRNTLLPQVQEDLSKENFLRIPSQRGKLHLYSQNPSRLKRALETYHPTEKRQKIKKIYEN